ncbi:MAG: hypothetical protein H8E67_08310, partial [Proteobacteria bacterium]|nr:hypothetical protein [Pseudomonadota bacterium]
MELDAGGVGCVRGGCTDVLINLTVGIGGDYVPPPHDPGRGGRGTEAASPDGRRRRGREQ